MMAEAGQGKSRLVAEARQSLASQVAWAEGRALSFTERMSYWVARDLLRALLGVKVEAVPAELERALRSSVERLFPERVAEVYPYLARLMELPLAPELQERVQYLSPEALQGRLLRAIADYVGARAREQPLVLVGEDLHWADPSSLQLLEALAPLTGQVPLLLLLVFRPEEGRIRAFHERLCSTLGEEYHIIELTPLSRQESTRLLHNLLRIENLPRQTRQLILDKAEGNAFFLEEVLRSLIDAGLVVLQGEKVVATQAIEALQVPDTLQGVIMARIDRLPPEQKQTLQTASVIGRVFQQRVLAYLLEAEPVRAHLDASLTELQRRELIRRRMGESAATGIDLEYIFKHVLTQDVTYHSLLIARRKELHQVTGEAIEALFPERLEELSATLGYHFERAGLPEKAAPYLARAADRARSLYANTEAIALYRTALEQVDQILAAGPEEPKPWNILAARLHESLSDVLELTGHHEEARAAYRSALSQVPPQDRFWQSRLHRRIGDTWMPERRYEEALQAYTAAEAALGAAPADPVPEWWQEWSNVQFDRMSVHYRLGQAPQMAALIEQTRPMVEQFGTPRQRTQLLLRLHMMMARRDRYRISEETLGYARDAAVAIQEEGDLAEISQAQFALGFCSLWADRLDTAEEHLQAALAGAERTGNVRLQTLALTYQSVLSRKRGRVEETRRLSARALAVATAAGRPDYIGAAHGNLSWVAWREGDLTTAQAEGQAALALWEPGFYMFRWIGLWPLIGVAVAQGEIAEAIAQIRALLEPSQQALPAALTRLLEQAIQAWQEGRPDAARSQLQEAAELARGMGYL